MRSHHHTTTAAHPEGRVVGAGLLYGGVGLALAVAMQVAGLFKKGDIRLQEKLLDGVFRGVAPDVLSLPLLVIVAAVFCFGVAFAVLDSPASWRRVVLGVTALVIILAMVPTFAVWKVYFSPFLPSIALLWTWFCVMMYVNHHKMPCDVLSDNAEIPVAGHEAAAQSVEKENTDGIKVGSEAEKTAGKEVEKKKTESKQQAEQDPDMKYQPKDEKEEKTDG